MRGLGCLVKQGWLPLIGLNALLGGGVTLVLPIALGRSVDSIVAGAERTQWLIAVVALITLGVAASLIDVFKRPSANGIGADHAGLAAVTTIAAVVPPAGSLVWLAVIGPALAAAFVGCTLLTLGSQPAPSFHRPTRPRLRRITSCRTAVPVLPSTSEFPG
jgi:ATP-binding cassette subfamily B protein